MITKPGYRICWSTLLFVLLFSSSITPTVGQQQNEDETNRPNILFVFADDHAYQATQAYPGRLDRLDPTPTIDRLADQGMVFENAFVPNSICGPSRATILTGQYSHKNGFFTNGQNFNNEQLTFPERLRDVGYQTAIVGKWHLGVKPQGFDYFEVLYGQGPYFNPSMRTPEGKENHKGYTTNVITDQTLKWLKNKRKPDQPFMLMYQHKAPHRNWQPDPDDMDLYDDVKIPEPDTLFDDYSNRASPASNHAMGIGEHMRLGGDLKVHGKGAFDGQYGERNRYYVNHKDELKGKSLVRWKYQKYMKDYLRCIRSIDRNLNRVLQYLEEAGLAENTVVIYSSDQGFYLGEHGWFDKRWMYEESLRTPLIVRWPDQIQPGRREDAFVSNLDFAQTFLDLAGVDEFPEQMQGRSLVPLMKGETPQDWRDSFYYHYYEDGPHSVAKHYGVRTDRYKLIHYYKQNEWELFDLKEDPKELNSVYGDAGYADVQKRLKKELKRLQKKYDEPHPETSLKRYQGRKARRNAVEQLSEGSLTPVFQIDGPGEKVPNQPDSGKKPLTVGARCTPTGGDGVLVSQGGRTDGFSLYLKNGHPHFSVQAHTRRYTVRADEPVPMNKSVHIAGMIDEDANLRLFVNGTEVKRKEGFPLTDTPVHPLAIGKDTKDKSGDYNGSMPFQGDLSDIRLYWGVLPGEKLQQWVGK